MLSVGPWLLGLISSPLPPRSLGAQVLLATPAPSEPDAPPASLLPGELSPTGAQKCRQRESTDSKHFHSRTILTEASAMLARWPPSTLLPSPLCAADRRGRSTTGGYWVPRAPRG